MQRTSRGRYRCAAIAMALVSIASLGLADSAQASSSQAQVEFETRLVSYTLDPVAAQYFVTNKLALNVVHHHIYTGTETPGVGYEVDAIDINAGVLSSMFTPSEEVGLLDFLALGGEITAFDDGTAAPMQLLMQMPTQQIDNNTMVTASGAASTYDWLKQLIEELLRTLDQVDGTSEDPGSDKDSGTDDDDSDGEVGPNDGDGIPTDNTW